MSQVTRDEPEFERWRAEADRALTGARVQAEAGLHNWACFAAEQAADPAEAIADAWTVLDAVDEAWRSFR